MHRSRFVLLLIAVAWMPISAMAQSRPPKPYAPVAITRPAAFDDASFSAFRDALAGAAKSRIYAELIPLVRRQGFFWDRDFDRKFDPRRPAVDNLAAAIRLEEDNGGGWDVLAAFAKDDSAEPQESRPGVMCAPARPSFDSLAFAKLLDVTDTEEIDWAYARSDDTTARDAPRADAAPLGTLGVNLVRLRGFEGPGTDRKAWAQIALPDGKIGYVAPGSLISLTGARLCYIKDPVSGWRITGVIAARTRPHLTESAK
jgi:hypothetical protein